MYEVVLFFLHCLVFSIPGLPSRFQREGETSSSSSRQPWSPKPALKKRTPCTASSITGNKMSEA